MRMSSSHSRVLSEHRLKIWITYALAAAALVWVFYDVEWSALTEQVQQLSWGWVAVIIGFDVLSFYVQGIRWKMLLEPAGRISYVKTMQAIYVGLFSSEILPLRAGEIVRGVLVSRWLKRQFHDILPSMALERLFDGIWFSSAMIITALLVDVPPQIHVATNVLLGLSVIGIAAFIWIAKRTHFAETAPAHKPITVTEKLKHSLFEIRQGLKQIGLGGRFFSAFGVSGLLHVVQALAFLSVLKACGIDLPMLAQIAVFLVVHLGIAIPNAPANVGTFQLFCVLGLTFFGIDKSSAAAFSVVAFAILTVPVLLIGFLATLYAGLSLTSLRTELSDADVAEGTA
jgi:glycosyltransferase 2 family protein